MRRLGVAAAVALTGWALAPQFALAQKIGVASSVKNDVQRVAPAPAQAIGAGSSLISNEHLRTGEASSAQLLFLDETSVSMGAQSDLVLDRFVYNPNRASGNVVLSTARGALRFVTGSQNPTNYTINTPVASIGVRGTIAEIFTYAASGLIFSRITDVEGVVVVTARSGQVVQLTPGTSVLVSSAGAVEGPYKADLSGINTAGTVPMYGPAIPTTSRTFDVPDSRLDMTDQLKGLSQSEPSRSVIEQLHTVTPPPPPPPSPPPPRTRG
ncbi:MAG: FecR domain-containing protein [Xanthobacteraceae bacterium]|nr:FecR domain-containing protein [Xanthobacteraceae bacterium]